MKIKKLKEKQKKPKQRKTKKWDMDIGDIKRKEEEKSDRFNDKRYYLQNNY